MANSTTTFPYSANNQITIRCDRASGDNKGGVMISLPQYIQPTNTYRYPSNGIEALSTILLTNNTQIQITLLYRSPSIPLQTFTDLLSRVLNRISTSSLPTIILGDFNEDVWHYTESDSRINYEFYV